MENYTKYYKEAPDIGSWSNYSLFNLSEEIC